MVSFQISHVSTVPNSSSPFSARSRTPSTLSKIHFNLVPEKYASITSPVLARKVSTSPLSFRLSQYSDVLRHCHTIAWYTGSPVSLSHTMVVSRWFVMPIAAMSSAVAPIFDMASTATPSCVDQISLASCSTQPGFGKYCVNSFWATLHISPFSLKRIHLLLVVPESSAITYFAIKTLLFFPRCFLSRKLLSCCCDTLHFLPRRFLPRRFLMYHLY